MRATDAKCRQWYNAQIRSKGDFRIYIDRYIVLLNFYYVN